MKTKEIVTDSLLFPLACAKPAFSQQSGPQRVLAASLADSQVVNQVLRALKKQEMPPLHVTNGDKEYWLIENRIQDRPLKTLPETEIHQLAVKNMRQKDFRYKMTAVLDGRIKIVTRLIHRRNGKWQVHSRNIHAKGWWLKRGDYYFSSL